MKVINTMHSLHREFVRRSIDKCLEDLNSSFREGRNSCRVLTDSPLPVLADLIVQELRTHGVYVYQDVDDEFIYYYATTEPPKRGLMARLFGPTPYSPQARHA